MTMMAVIITTTVASEKNTINIKGISNDGHKGSVDQQQCSSSLSCDHDTACTSSWCDSVYGCKHEIVDCQPCSNDIHGRAVVVDIAFVIDFSLLDTNNNNNNNNTHVICDTIERFIAGLTTNYTPSAQSRAALFTLSPTGLKLLTAYTSCASCIANQCRAMIAVSQPSLTTLPLSTKTLSRHFGNSRVTALLYSLDVIVNNTHTHLGVVNGHFRHDAQRHIITFLSTQSWQSSNGGGKGDAKANGERSKRWNERVTKSIASLAKLFDNNHASITIVLDSSSSHTYGTSNSNSNTRPIGLNPVGERSEVLKWLGNPRHDQSYRDTRGYTRANVMRSYNMHIIIITR
jgi:hypothetical protein